MNTKRPLFSNPTTTQAFLRVVERSLTTPQNGAQLAGQVYLSRFHFQRVFRETVGETPSRLQKRLLLERAAFDLRNGDKLVTLVAIEAGYQSLEGFSRAFKSAYRLSPAAYRRAARRICDLPGTSGIHYTPSGASRRGAPPTPLKGYENMDLTDRLLLSDYRTKHSLFACALLLSDAQLDAPLLFRHNLMPFVEPARTLRESLIWLSFSGWVDQMFNEIGWTPPSDDYRRITGTSIADLSAKFEGYHAAFQAFVRHVRDENRWDEEWVDDSCEQPETFAIGMVIEATINWDCVLRSVLVRQMEQMGFAIDYPA